MMLKTILTLVFAVFVLGCDHSSKTVVDARTNNEVSSPKTMKIAVFKDGRIEIEGTGLSVAAAVAKIQLASSTDTHVYYFREAGLEEPHPNAMRVFETIVEAKLPISLSTKPDFSTYVDAEGNERLRE